MVYGSATVSFCSELPDADSHTAAGRQSLLQHGLAGHLTAADDVVLRVGAPVRFLAVGIDGGLVLPDFVNAYPKIHLRTMERYVDAVS